MLRADQAPITAKIEWDAAKKQWHVVLTVGAEVIKRWVPSPHETADDALRTVAVETAKDEGYDLDASHVAVTR